MTYGGCTARWTDRRVRTSTATGMRRVAAVLDAVDRAERVGAALHEPAPSADPSPPRPRGRLRSIAIGLTAVNAGVVVLMYASSDRGDLPGLATAVLLATLLAGTQITLALALGSRLQEIAHRAPLLPSRTLSRSAYCLGTALAILSTLVGWLIHLWTQTRMADDHPRLAVLLGMTLALQAWVAPWLLVDEIVRSRTTARRRQEILDRHVRRLVADREALRSTASLALVAARSAQHRADRIAARAQGHPPQESWTHALRVLGAAVVEAEIRYRGLVATMVDGDLPSEPPGRPDVDLAG